MMMVDANSGAKSLLRNVYIAVTVYKVVNVASTDELRGALTRAEGPPCAPLTVTAVTRG